MIIKKGFKELKQGTRTAKYQRYLCKDCNHLFTPGRKNSSHYDSLSLQAKIIFEYLLNRSLRKVKTSKVIGHVGKDKILNIVLSASKKFIEISELNKRLDIAWSGKFALDAFFIKILGKSFAVLLCSDFESLDIIDYHIAPFENFDSWHEFLLKIYPELTKKKTEKFFVTDGKRGLHQALSRIFPSIPVQLCTTHKQRRINQIVPHIHGDGYDKLFAHLAHKAITAPIKPVYNLYLNVLLRIRKSTEFDQFPESRQNKLNKIIGALRFQKSKLHTRYDLAELIEDTTTNHLEGINSFFKERTKLFKGFKNKENAKLLIKLLVYYYRFHKFTSSGFKERNGKRPIELNILNNQQFLNKILKGNEPYSWIRNLLSGT